MELYSTVKPGSPPAGRRCGPETVQLHLAGVLPHPEGKLPRDAQGEFPPVALA